MISGFTGFALGPLWGGSLFAASSAPGALGVLGKGRMFFIVLTTLAAANSQLARPRVPSSALRHRREASTHTQAFSLPPWPEDKSPWRYLLRCRSSSLQDLSSSGTLLY